MTLIDFIPGAALARNLMVGGLVAGVCTMGAGLWGMYRHHGGVVQGRAEVQARWNAAELVRANVATKAEQAARTEELRRTAAQREAINEHERIAARSRADAAGAADAGRLFVAAARAAAGGGLRTRDPTAAGSCEAAHQAGELLADVLGRAESRLRELAQYADAASDAGSLCAASYDALTP
jgi:hypothetical protein